MRILARVGVIERSFHRIRKSSHIKGTVFQREDRIMVNGTVLFEVGYAEERPTKE
jgi:hypothetical protein